MTVVLFVVLSALYLWPPLEFCFVFGGRDLYTTSCASLSESPQSMYPSFRIGQPPLFSLTLGVFF